MHQNLYIRKHQYTALAMAIALAACGGEGGNNKDSGGSPEFVAPATISAQNATFITEYADSYVVDLSDKVSVNGGHSFTLVEVKTLTQSNECEPLQTMAQSFTVSADSARSCDYEYKVAITEAAPASSANSAIAPASLTGAPTDVAITRVAVTNEVPADSTEVELPAISAVTLVQELAEVDVKEQLLIQAGQSVPDGYTLSSDLSLPYSTNVATADALTDTISYTPPGGFEGIERILFSYINEATGDVLLGTLDIAVSHTANEGLLVEDDITYDEVEINQSNIIDVSSYVRSLDDDDFQLVYVDSFNAATAPLDPDDISNTAFTFETSKMGNHYVSFAVSDNNGAIAMGLMEVPAFDPNKTGQWDGIFYQGLYFTGPLTIQEAAGKQITYNDTLVDNYYNPAVDLALFSAGNALNYCGSQGRLPTSEELTLLSAESVQTNHNWPISEQYMANDDGTYKTVDLTTGIVTDYLGGNYIVSCIEGGLTVQPPTTETIANGVEEAEVVFTLLGQDEEPITGPSLSFTVSSPSNQAALVSLNEATDVNGQAVARVTNIKAEDVEVCGEVGIQTTCASVTFVGDPATAEIVKTEHDVIGWTPGDATPYPLKAIVQDVNQNPVGGVMVEFNELENYGENTEEMTYPNSTISPEHPETTRVVVTENDGIAYIDVVNDKETGDFDETVIGTTHLNKSSARTTIKHPTFWGMWQWTTPLDVVGVFGPFVKSDLKNDAFCPEGYRYMTKAEVREYEDAIDNHPLLAQELRSVNTDPIFRATDKMAVNQISAWLFGDYQDYRDNRWYRNEEIWFRFHIIGDTTITPYGDGDLFTETVHFSHDYQYGKAGYAIGHTDEEASYRGVVFDYRDNGIDFNNVVKGYNLFCVKPM